MYTNFLYKIQTATSSKLHNRIPFYFLCRRITFGVPDIYMPNWTTHLTIGHEVEIACVVEGFESLKNILISRVEPTTGSNITVASVSEGVLDSGFTKVIANVTAAILVVQLESAQCSKRGTYRCDADGVGKITYDTFKLTFEVR